MRPIAVGERPPSKFFIMRLNRGDAMVRAAALEMPRFMVMAAAALGGDQVEEQPAGEEKKPVLQ